VGDQGDDFEGYGHASGSFFLAEDLETFDEQDMGEEEDGYEWDRLDQIEEDLGVYGWRIKAERGLNPIGIKVNPMQYYRLELVNEEVPAMLKQVKSFSGQPE